MDEEVDRRLSLLAIADALTVVNERDEEEGKKQMFEGPAIHPLSRCTRVQ